MTILKGVFINYLGQVSRLRSTSTYPRCLIRKFNPKCGSQLAPGRIEKVEDAVKVGDEIMVKVVEIDSQGRMNLSRKAVLNGGDVEDYVVARPPRGNGPFGGGGGGGDRDGGDRPRRRRD